MCGVTAENIEKNIVSYENEKLILRYLNNQEVPEFKCPHHKDIITIDEECNNYYIENIFKVNNEEITKLKNDL